MVEAWVNWNPDPEVHAFGEQRQARTVALCGVMVRERHGEFDPAEDRACHWCVEGLRLGFGVEETRHLRSIATGTVIACRRPSR